MHEITRILETEFLDNRVLTWCLALGAFLVTFTVLPLIRGYIRALRKRKPVHEHGVLDLGLVLVTRTTRLFLFALALGSGCRCSRCRSVSRAPPTK